MRTAIAASLLLCSACAPRAPRVLPELSRLPEFRAQAVTVSSQRPLNSAELQGGPWVAGFIFTRCQGPCPVISARMARLQDRLPPEVRLASITVDPAWDTPEVLGRYARSLGADPERWLFLRLESRPLYELLYAGFRLPVLRDERAGQGYRVIHSAKLALVDQRGRVRGYYEAGEEDALEEDVAALLSGGDHG